ncbi:ATP-grasp domain-containing protein [bacterium]|jgi:carbamoylphosphate synthase large subunit|nr:ATP-grasp domain-containing protein [bacterium]
MKKRKITFLLTPGGGPGILALVHSLKISKKYQVRIVMADSNPASGNMFLESIDKRYQIPNCHDSEFIPAMLRLIKCECIDYYYSGLDEEMPVISRNKELINAIGCKVLLPPEGSLEKSWDKLATHKFLERTEVRLPRTWVLSDLQDPLVIFKKLTGRVIIKGISSRGGRYIDIPEDQEEFICAIKRAYKIREQTGMEYILQEYIIGAEYNVSTLHDNNKRLIYAVSRRKFEERKIKSTTIAAVIHQRDDVIEQALYVINEMKLVPGFNNVEMVVSDNDGLPYFIEVNGGRAAAQDMNIVASGINITDLFIDLAEGRNVKSIPHPKDGLASLKIRSDVIVDYSDIIQVPRI